MRLTRPVAIGMLVLLAALVLWLMVSQRGADEGLPGAAPTTQSSPGSDAATSPESTTDSAAPAQEPTDTPADDAGEAGPAGVDTRDWDAIDACDDGILPDELDPVVDDVEAGGPYDYPDKDGSTFGNYEGYLPEESRGYYREFTVETPGLSHRGAKRVVTGGGGVDPEVWYYTDDHYETFCEFAPGG